MSQEEREVLKEAMHPVYDEFTDVITKELIEGIEALKK